MKYNQSRKLILPCLQSMIIWVKVTNNNHQQRILKTKITKVLNLHQEWTRSNNMKLNILKTAYQFVTLRHQYPIFNQNINNQILPNNDNTKYLG